MDLQLDVKGCKNVYDSFVKYTEVEKLDGQNQYKAEGHGLQVVYLPISRTLQCVSLLQFLGQCSPCNVHQSASLRETHSCSRRSVPHLA